MLPAVPSPAPSVTSYVSSSSPPPNHSPLSGTNLVVESQIEELDSIEDLLTRRTAAQKKDPAASKTEGKYIFGRLNTWSQNVKQKKNITDDELDTMKREVTESCKYTDPHLYAAGEEVVVTKGGAIRDTSLGGIDAATKGEQNTKDTKPSQASEAGGGTEASTWAEKLFPSPSRRC
jgi:hypothetical protein